MVAMAGDFGADVRLVAFMQYLRVLFVASAAALVARIGLGDEAHSVSLLWFPPLNQGFVITLVVMLTGAWLGTRLRIPSGACRYCAVPHPPAQAAAARQKECAVGCPATRPSASPPG